MIIYIDTSYRCQRTLSYQVRRIDKLSDPHPEHLECFKFWNIMCVQSGVYVCVCVRIPWEQGSITNMKLVTLYIHLDPIARGS